MIITRGSILEEIYQAWDGVFHQQIKQYTKKRVENTTRSGVFLTNFECAEWLILLLKQNDF